MSPSPSSAACYAAGGCFYLKLGFQSPRVRMGFYEKFSPSGFLEGDHILEWDEERTGDLVGIFPIRVRESPLEDHLPDLLVGDMQPLARLFQCEIHVHIVRLQIL